MDIPSTLAGGTRGYIIEPGSGQESFIINCISIAAYDNFRKRGLGTAYFYNCTSIDAGERGFYGQIGTMVVRNCLADGSITDFKEDTTLSGDYNAASDNSVDIPGVNSRINQTFTFVNAGNNDYHLASNDAGAKTFGADLSADGTFAFDDDIDGETRS